MKLSLTAVVLSCLLKNVHSFHFRAGMKDTLRPPRQPSKLYSESDNGDSLDEAWRQFQEDREQSVSVSITDFALSSKSSLFSPPADTTTMESSVAVGVFFLVAVACLLGIFVNGESPLIIDESITALEDVDSAEGRFHALTGGVWL